MSGERPRPVLYIMCGLPFAGKSTAARTPASLKNAAIVELDQINAASGLGFSQPITAEQWTGSYAEAYSRLRALLAASISATFDAVNFTKAQRDGLRQIASEFGAEATVVYVPVERQEAERRWIENRSTGARPDVRDKDFALVADNFEPPDEDEVALVIR
jgi:predicted kinase